MYFSHLSTPFLCAFLFTCIACAPANEPDPDNDVPQAAGIQTPLAAFEAFNPLAVTVSFDQNTVTLTSNGLPNHTSPYWNEDHPLYIDKIMGDHVNPGKINERSYSATLPLYPQTSETSFATGLGPIGIAVTGAPIYNGQEGPNIALNEQTAESFDYAGAHNGPSGYHYHIESFDVPENTVLSHNDSRLVGIMADGFLLYGRKDADGTYPNDLDASGGHIGTTPHAQDVQHYHYHIVNEYYINNMILLFGGDLKGRPNSIL